MVCAGLTEAAMQGPDIRFVSEDVDRHGNVRLYFRRNGVKVRIRETMYSEAFWSKYRELLRLSEGGGLVAGGRATVTPPVGTYRWLCVRYLTSAAFRRLDPSTQTWRRQVLDATFNEPVQPGARETFAEMPLANVTTKNLRVLRDRKIGLPAAANNRVKAIQAAFKWALEEELIAHNPARDLTKLRAANDGHHSWSAEEVAAFEKRHEVGSKARLAMALMLWTGVRRSDVVLLGRQHVRSGWLRFTQQKNRNRQPTLIEVPLLPELQRIISASPCGDLTFLVNDAGQPYTVAGFGNWFRERCLEAEVPGRAHGLRKAGAATAAENGATAKQLMAIFGWLSLSEAERYTRSADRRKMAGDAMGLLINRKNQEQ